MQVIQKSQFFRATLKQGIPIPMANPDALRWRGVWQPGPYLFNDIVRDGRWAMVCTNPAGTAERPAPLPGTATRWLLPEVPSWTTTPSAERTIRQGLRLVAPEYSFIDYGRIWNPPGISGEVRLTMDLRIHPDTMGQVQWRSNHQYQEGLAAGEWWEFFADASFFVYKKSVIDVELTITNNGTLVSHPGSFYLYLRPDSLHPPNNGEIIHALQSPDQMNIAYIDHDSNDVTAILQALKVGDQIQGGGWYNWEITGTVPQAGYQQFTVTPAESQIGADTVEGFTFSERIYSPVNLVALPDFWSSDPNAQGYLWTGAPPVQQWTEDAYGLDIRFQDGISSPDWEMVAYSAAG